MPTQEDRVLSRIKQTNAYIRDIGMVKMEILEAWALTTLGIRSRTLVTYVVALKNMGTINIDSKTQEITWNGEKP